ncbi:hypothetical protein ADK33_06250 [Streptomyces griseus subsp. rhodochrous]|nr:hypothetical protein ADK33_06250 [Streptomyces griseus subsp. rhodochrous]
MAARRPVHPAGLRPAHRGGARPAARRTAAAGRMRAGPARGRVPPPGPPARDRSAYPADPPVGARGRTGLRRTRHGRASRGGPGRRR